MKKFEVKNDTHIIIKEEHLSALFSPDEYNQMIGLLKLLEERKNLNGYNQHKYYICNLDEPYAQDVLDVIRNGELNK